MIDTILSIALFLFIFAILLALYRIIKGPSMPDRVVALDMIGVNLISGVAVFSVVLQTHALLAVLLSLSGTFIYFWASENFISVRLLLGIMFVFLTAPVAGHLITRAAYRSRVKLSASSTEDSLHDALYGKQKDSQ